MSNSIATIYLAISLANAGIHPSIKKESALENISTMPVIKKSGSRFRKLRFESQNQPNLLALKAVKLEGNYVGELQERWRFPSDHLPIGVTIDGFHVATWNVLNAEFMRWVEMDTQGLKNSIIMEEHVSVDDSHLTVRDQHVADQIIQMIEHPTHPRSILSLQECSMPFIEELKRRLPENMKMVLCSDASVKDQNVIIYDSQQFAYLKDESRIVRDAYPSEGYGRALMDAVFQNWSTNIKYRVINAHVPGNPDLPGRLEFAKYVMSRESQDYVTMAMGDMNFELQEMNEAFRSASLDLEKTNPFEGYAAYYTNIGIDKRAKTIDAIFVSGGKFDSTVSVNRPQEVLSEGLQEAVDLLHGE
jgi:endonuclease/exonuclease/phosphatase family metal-dependent hydrolase